MKKPFAISAAANPRREALVAETLLMMHIIDSAEEVGDCWIWQLATTPQGYPIMKIAGHGCCHVRRVVATLAGHRLAPRQPVEACCEERGCVKPQHMAPSSIRAIAKKAGQHGAFSSLARRAKIAAARRRAPGVKLTIDIAREIRLSEESGPVLAARYGIDKSLVNSIKRGEAWREYQSTPFSGLMAANDARRRGVA